MNSVIEAQQEYQCFHYHPQTLAPGLPVTHHPRYAFGPDWVRKLADKVEAEEIEVWRRENTRLVEKQKGDLWDTKLKNDVA